MKSIDLEKFGFMYCGGEKITYDKSQINFVDERQSHYINQAVVHYMIPKNKTKKYPIVLIPGLCLRASLYLDTPDGREGWAQMFLKQGYEVYIFEEPTGAAAGFNYNSFRPDVETKAFFISFGQEEAWERWGIGLEGVKYEDSKFPVDNIEELFKSFTPVYSEKLEIFNKENPFNVNEKSDALVDLLDKIGPSIILNHSASGFTGFETARKKGDYVKAMHLILQQKEPDDFVIATGESHSVQEFVELAFAEAGLDWKKYVTQDERFMRPADVPDLRGDITKAKSKLGWEPEIKFSELVKMMVKADLEKYNK